MTVSASWTDWSCRVRLTVTDDDALQPARLHLIRLMADVARAASRFDPASDISQVNDGAGHLVPVSGRTIALVDVALDAAAASAGVVDPTVGAHVVRAGYAADIETVLERATFRPSPEPTPHRADWTSVRVDHELSRIGVPPGILLDLGATAKPWTVDVAAHTIAATHATGVLVEIGGDVAAAGRRATPWQIEVSEKAGQSGERVGLTTGGLATSSTAARRWPTTGGFGHHIIDPRTGEPADGSWRTATVWARSAVEANVSSTAAIVLGDTAIAYLQELTCPARLVGHDGQVRFVGAWPATSQAA